MSSKPGVAVRVRGLGKSYTISHQSRDRHITLAESLLARLRRPLARKSKETFWALKDVEFDIETGDVVGIIGRNGAGKSTLLKILSRITEPTVGQIDLYGRVGSLLEVGTGFHPELTGRENIFLNGAILGMTKSEIRTQFDAIVDFAGVERFLDTPVKRYSSGMYVRLAFAVAAHLDSEILIVDEVLAVGDADFQERCLRKIQTVTQSGRTVLLVSHHLQSISKICTKGLLLQAGQILYAGSADATLEAYLRESALNTNSENDADSRPGTGEFRLYNVRVPQPTLKVGEPILLEFDAERRKSMFGMVYLSALVVDSNMRTICQLDSRLNAITLPNKEVTSGTLKILSPWLKPGRYHIDLYICVQGATPIVDRYDHACNFEIAPFLPYEGSASEDAISMATVLADFSWELN